MDYYVFTYKTHLSVSQEKAWRFFSNPANLENVQSFPPVSVFEDGTSITLYVRYTLKKLSLKTTITEEVVPHFFIDKMENPPFPFLYWEHKHAFQEEGTGTTMIDTVTFQTKGPPSFILFFLKCMFRGREKKLRAAFV